MANNPSIPIRTREPRARVPGVIWFDSCYRYGDENDLPRDIASIRARTCAHCGCYAPPLPDAIDEDKPTEELLCARGDMCIGGGVADPDVSDDEYDCAVREGREDEVQRHDLDVYWTDEPETFYSAPQACWECAERGHCLFGDGWDFVVEWPGVAPPNAFMLGGDEDKSGLWLASVGSAAEAVALARAKKGKALAYYKIDYNSNFRGEGIVLGRFDVDAVELPEVELPDCEEIPVRMR